MGCGMAHNKNRSDYAVGNVDWTNPELSELLEKIDGLSLEQRSNNPPRRVQIRVATGWDANASESSALLMGRIDGAMIVATKSPLPHGGEVEVSGIPGDGSRSLWAVVIDERQGCRAEDKDQSIYLNWLRPR